jgi:hypothetical protein
MKASMDAAGISGARLAVVLKGLGAAAAVGALAAVTNEFHMMRTRAAVADVAVKDLAKSLSDLADTGKVGSGLNSLFAEKGGLFGSDEKIVTTTEAIERFAYTAQDALGDDLYSKIVRLQDMGEGTARLGEYVGQMDAAFAEMVRAGNADKAAASLKMFLDGISDPAVRDEVLAQFTSYQAALDESAIAATNAARRHGGDRVRRAGRGGVRVRAGRHHPRVLGLPPCPPTRPSPHSRSPSTPPASPRTSTVARSR